MTSCTWMNLLWEPVAHHLLWLSEAVYVCGVDKVTSVAGIGVKYLVRPFLVHVPEVDHLSMKIKAKPASCEKGPSDICKTCRPRPAAVSPTQRLIRFYTFWHSSHQWHIFIFCCENILVTYRCFQHGWVYTICNVRRSLFAWRWQFYNSFNAQANFAHVQYYL